MTSATTMKAEGAPAATALMTSQIWRAAKARRAAAACHVIRRPRLRAGGTLTAVRRQRRGPNVDAMLQPLRPAIPRTTRFAPKTPESRQLARDSLIFEVSSSRIRNQIVLDRDFAANLAGSAAIWAAQQGDGSGPAGRRRAAESLLKSRRGGQRRGVGFVGCCGRRALAASLAFEVLGCLLAFGERALLGHHGSFDFVRRRVDPGDALRALVGDIAFQLVLSGLLFGLRARDEFLVRRWTPARSASSCRCQSVRRVRARRRVRPGIVTRIERVAARNSCGTR